MQLICLFEALRMVSPYQVIFDFLLRETGMFLWFPDFLYGLTVENSYLIDLRTARTTTQHNFCL